MQTQVRTNTSQVVARHGGLYRRFFKRPMDFILSLLALIVLSPVLLVVAVLVRLRLGSPVIFKQKRPGLNEKIFTMYKFRTMLDPQTRDGRKLTDLERLKCIEEGIDILTDNERLTKFGRILRSTSLDELPEIWNVLIGDMSIVGPRPLSTIYLDYYTDEEALRHSVRPGLTGLAQVQGRNTASWEKRFKYDIEYVSNVTFITDIKILFNTVAVVLSRENIGQGEERPEAFNVARQREWDKVILKNKEK